MRLRDIPEGYMTTTTHTSHTIAVYATHHQAEAAVKNLSIVGQNYETDEQPLGFVNTGDRMLTWGKLGAFWGAIWGILFGSAMMLIPGVGTFMFAGWVVSALEGAVLVGGAGALGAALVSVGIPKDSVLKYQSELKAGSFLVLAHGDPVQIDHAKKVLASTSASSIESFSTQQPVGVR